MNMYNNVLNIFYIEFGHKIRIKQNYKFIDNRQQYRNILYNTLMNGHIVSRMQVQTMPTMLNLKILS